MFLNICPAFANKLACPHSSLDVGSSLGVWVEILLGEVVGLRSSGQCGVKLTSQQLTPSVTNVRLKVQQ